MSYITNTILSFSIIEGEEDDFSDVISNVNEFFKGQEQKFVVPKSTDWYGGYKVLERPTFVAAFNHLNETGLVKHLRSMDWKEPDLVQIMFCHQDDRFYRSVCPFERID